MIKVKQKIISIVATISVTGTLMASLPISTSAAVVDEKSATNINLDLEDAAEYGKNLAISKNASNYGLADNVKEGAILHAWCWSFNTIKANMKDIAEAGFTTVQTSPANQCNDSRPQMRLWSDSNGTGGCWWWHYQPTDWVIGNYQLGDRNDFKSMCEEADKYGVKIIVDVIPNHTTSDLSRVSQNLYNAAGGFEKLYHKNYDVPCLDYSKRDQVTNYKYSKDGCPDVCTENPGFQERYIRYCNDLIELGCDGFRYDTAKHIGLPDDPLDEVTRRNGWTNNFWDVALGKTAVNGVKLKGDTNSLFVYGEVLQDAGSRDADYGRLFNLTASNYGHTLIDAIKSKNFSTGKISDWGNAAGASRLVTWVESHDTYCNGHDTADRSPWDIRMCWAIIAARKDGTPLFYSRPDGSNHQGNYWGNNVIGPKGNDDFKHPEVVAVNKFRNAMAGEGEYLRNPNGNQQILQIDRGRKGTVIINLGGQTSINNQPTTMADGTYTDQVSGRTFTVSGGKISGQLDGGKIAVIYDAKVTQNPKVSATPGSGSFKGDSVTLTLGLSNATSGTYTTSEGESGTFRDGDKITVGSNIAVGGTVTVTLKATGEAETTPANETFTYTKKDGSVKKNTVYFTLPAGWSNPNIYAYTGEGDTAVPLLGKWPGKPMISEGYGVYSYTFDEGVSSCRILFNSGDNQIPAQKVPGFDYVGGKAFEYVNSWVELEVKEPIKTGTVKVKYIDENENNLTSPITLTGNVGDSYTTSSKTFNGYKLSSTPSNASGKYTASEITVVYRYIKETAIEENGKVIVRYVDEDTNKEISSRTELIGKVGTSYSTTPKSISGYNVSFIPANKQGTYKTSDVTVTYYYLAEQKPNLQINSFTANKTSPQLAGKQILLTAQAMGTGTLEYKFLLKDNATGNWFKIQDFSTANTTVWKTGTTGNKTLYVDVKDSKGQMLRKSMSYLVNSAPAPTISSFTSNKTSPQLAGTQISLTARATGSGTLQYKFLIKDNTTGTWFVIRDYSTSNVATWKTGSKGNKTLYVDVKDSNGKTTRREMFYRIQ